MALRAGLAAFLLSAGLIAQETPPDLYRIDLVFNGLAFAFDEPKLQGETYLFHGWPDGALTRVKKVNVRGITPWTRSPVNQVAYRIDIVPDGHVLARDEPTLKGSTYVFRTSRDGTVMSVKQVDVRKITRLTGSQAFREEKATRGEVAIGNLAMQGGSSQAGPTNLNAAGRAGAPGPSNWVYDGAPGVTTAWAPASATVASPGDVPRAAPQ